MKILKIADVKTPNRGTPGSAGLDFFIPNDVFDVIVKPGKSVNIPSGILAKIPEGFALIAFNKSGRAIQGLQVGACVVDQDYQGEIHLHVHNLSKKPIMIKAGDKIVQMALIPINYSEVKEVSNIHELYEGIITDRGEGGFGSTGDS